jgi:putative nucleotidyltransferase with HDIG domain
MYDSVVILDQSIVDRALATRQGGSAYRIVETLLDAGFESWWVGGCVRDMLMGEIPREIDVATEALPTTIKQIFPKHDATGETFGTIIVSVDGCAVEVTTFREDDFASDGRRPESVIFTTKKELDAVRRDITVNAVYWNPISSATFDPFEGRRDLNERLIRIIGDPSERIRHDALRLIRIVRFRAKIDGQYHPETFEALHKNAKLISVLSGSRRFQELDRILMGPHPDIAFNDLWETDILEYLLPELHACKGVAQPNIPHTEGDVWEHVCHIISSFTIDHGQDIRWAALLHDIGKPKTFSIADDRIHFNEHAKVGSTIARSLLDRLQCPGIRRDRTCWLIAHHMMMGTFFEIDDTRKAHWYYHPWFLDLLQLFWLDIAGTGQQDFTMYDRIIDDYNTFLDAHPAPKKPLLSGDDVMELLELPPGEQVGKILKDMYDAQMNGNISTKAEAVLFIKGLHE